MTAGLWALALLLAAPPSPPDGLVIERVTVRGVRLGRGAAMVQQSGLHAGDPVDDAAVAEARARLLETGLFHTVQPRLERGSARGQAVVVFECDERTTTSIDAIHLGHARPTELWGGLEISDIDPLGVGLSAEAGVVGARDQQAGRLAVGRANLFEGVDLRVQGRFLHGEEPFVGPRGQRLGGEDVAQIFVPYRRASLEGQLRFAFVPLVHATAGLRLEYLDAALPTRAATQVDADGSEHPFDFAVDDGAGFLAVGAFGLHHDTRDDPAFPTRGRRASFALAAGAGPFARFLAGFEQYWSLPFRHVLRLDLKAGAIMGDAPFFERFFVGDLHPYIPERALGLNFARRRGPGLLDLGLGEQRYEDFAGRLGFEYRVPLGAGPRREHNGVELFVGAALLSLGSPSEIADPDGPGLPMDAAIDVGLRIESEIGVMGLSVGNIFLLLDP
ncbi:MAG: BamA/TamA family outer membrane protein [Myxococcales bacterium]|nr:BamA/TamA family outer membrane protein [Myxococcales bacterium]